MKAYVIATGAIFALLTIAHVARVAMEKHLATDPVFILFTVLSAALSIWAWRVYRRLT
jgi:uncharacterized membrane protein